MIRKAGAFDARVTDGVQRALSDIRCRPFPRDGCKPVFDQSIFVRAFADGVLREAAMAAALTGSDDPAVLGSGRSTLIICISIPLSILVALRRCGTGRR